MQFCLMRRLSPLSAKFLSYCVEVLVLDRFWILLQMAFKFFEPWVLLLLKLVVIVVQSLRPLKERPLHFAGIGCACDVESVPGPRPSLWAPHRWVVSYSPGQLVEREILLWSRFCSELLNITIVARAILLWSRFCSELLNLTIGERFHVSALRSMGIYPAKLRVKWRFSLPRRERSLPVFGRRAWWCVGTRGWRCAGPFPGCRCS